MRGVDVAGRVLFAGRQLDAVDVIRQHVLEPVPGGVRLQLCACAVGLGLAFGNEVKLAVELVVGEARLERLPLHATQTNVDEC